jgi:organic radical activating enzyme
VFKFVAVSVEDLDEIATLVDTHDLSPVWIMPEGTDPDALIALAKELAAPVIARGWNFTPRLHVLLWGDERGR